MIETGPSNPPPPDMRRWFVSHQGQKYGPYPTYVLVDSIVLGRVAAEALVSDGGPWITASDFMTRQAKEAVAAAAAAAPASAAAVPGAPPPPPAPPSPPRSSGQREIDPADLIESAPPAGAVTTLDDTAHGVPSPADGATPPPPPPQPDQPQQQPKPRARPKVDDLAPERDRIVVIGRRQSGKTIYLASVYEKLWRSLNGITARALSGDVHRQLMLVNQTLRQGEWPAATLGTSRMEMEIEHDGKRRLMVTLDFAGELFRKAFLEEQSNFPGVAELCDHIDHAAAVILLVDPSVVAGMDHEAAMDDDFGLVQAVHRIRNWPGGDDVPIVLVLTKMDQNQALLDRFGSAKEFVRTHFPALVRTMRQIPIFQVSAVQTDRAADGQFRPRPDSHPINVDSPLQFCLRALSSSEDEEEQRRLERERQMLEMRLEREERMREKRQNLWLAVAITSIVVVGLAIAAVILIKNV